MISFSITSIKNCNAYKNFDNATTLDKSKTIISCSDNEVEDGKTAGKKASAETELGVLVRTQQFAPNAPRIEPRYLFGQFSKPQSCTKQATTVKNSLMQL